MLRAAIPLLLTAACLTAGLKPIDPSSLEKHKDDDCTMFNMPASWFSKVLAEERGVPVGTEELLKKQLNALNELYKSSGSKWPAAWKENWGDLAKGCNWEAKGMKGNWWGTSCSYSPYSPAPPRACGKNVQAVNLVHGMLQGTLHDDWRWMICLPVLDIKGNDLHGTLPDTGLWMATMVFDVGHNKFSGTLPPGFLPSPCLQILNLQHNRFEGTIPDTLRDRTILMALKLNNNEFSGTIPSFGTMPHLAELDLSSNRLSGTLPSDFFAGLPRLRWLRLHQNEIAGPIPLGIASSSPLISVLSVAGTKMDDAVPAEVAALGMLRVFNGTATMKCIPPDLLRRIPESTSCGGRAIGSVAPQQ